jgi:hypothetical protein
VTRLATALVLSTRLAAVLAAWLAPPPPCPGPAAHGLYVSLRRPRWAKGTLVTVARTGKRIRWGWPR